MILLKLFDGGVGKNMLKAAQPSSGMDSSNPRRWRGKRLHHHGDVVCRSLCFFWGFWLVTHQSDSSYLCFRGVTKWPTQVAPYQHKYVTFVITLPQLPVCIHWCHPWGCQHLATGCWNIARAENRPSSAIIVFSLYLKILVYNQSMLMLSLI